MQFGITRPHREHVDTTPHNPRESANNPVPVLDVGQKAVPATPSAAVDRTNFERSEAGEDKLSSTWIRRSRSKPVATESSQNASYDIELTAQQKTLGRNSRPSAFENSRETSLLVVERERFADHGAFDQSCTDQFDGHLTANNLAVFHDADLLDVLLKQTTRDSGCFAAVTAKVFCLTSLGEAVTLRRLQIAVFLRLFGEFDSLVLFQCAHQTMSVGFLGPGNVGSSDPQSNSLLSKAKIGAANLTLRPAQPPV